MEMLIRLVIKGEVKIIYITYRKIVIYGGFDMNDFGLIEMQKIQKQLQEKYKDKWGGLSPDKGRNQLLWMMIEVGEVADIIKKKGDNHIMNDEETRDHFVEELCDVLMYFNDVMLCYSISPEELKKVYLQKHNKNIERW
jgi:NTP pyrophosphatase (non-canonical NTP hydrolase)